MTIPIKIQCGCGQPYAFDIEPVEGRMPGEVSCPACGADGTAAANAIIAESIRPHTPQSAYSSSPVSAAPMRLATTAAPTTTPSTSARRAGTVRQVDPEQVRHEARAKIFWGDAPEEVVKFLMIQGVPVQEASEMVAEIRAERAATIRANGIKKIFVGAGMICVPIGSWITFVSIGFIPVKIFAITVMIGLYGAYLVLKGSIMAMAPKSEPGDVADQ